MVGSRYRIINVESNPTYIPGCLCGPIFVRLGPKIGTITVQPNMHKWDNSGGVPNAKWWGVLVLYVNGLYLINVAAWRMACPQTNIGKLDCISNGITAICSLLMTDSAVPFWKCTRGTDYWVSIPAVQQKSLKASEVNSPAPSTCNIQIGWSWNWAFNFRIWAKILANAKFCVDSREICNHLVEESISTKKYLNGPLGRSMGPQISMFICCRKFGIV